jgi:DNA-binding MarR family transcriptional regulator
MRNNSRDLDLYDGFLRFNRRLLSILKLLKPPLTTNESHALAALTVQSETLVAKDLVRTLRLEKSTLSRMLKQLISKSLLAEIPAAEDKRKKHLRITSEGQRVLLEDSRLRNREVEVTAAPLSPFEQAELTRLLRYMADTLGEPKVDDHPEDNPLKREIRRLTRGMGFIGASCMRTGRSVEECQILRLLVSAQGTLPFSELNRILPYDVSALSRLITQLEGEKLLTKSRNSSDQRAVFIKITPRGIEVDAESIEKSARFFRIALAGLPEREWDLLADLVRRFTSKEFDPKELGSIGEYETIVLEREIDKQRYRALLVESLVRSNHHHSLSETLLGAKSLCLAIERSGEPVAISEITFTSGPAKLIHLVFLGTAARSTSEQSAVSERLFEAAAKNKRLASVDIQNPLLEPLIPRSLAKSVLPQGGVRVNLRPPKRN